MPFGFLKKAELTNREKIHLEPRPIVLVILDGLGISPIPNGNAVWNARMPNFEYYQRYYPKTLLHSSSNEVGLPYGEFGNSEVGHLNIGSGRIVYQPLLRVTNEIESGKLYDNKTMGDIKKHLQDTCGNLHLMGLVSAGGVHSHIEHILALLDWCNKEKIKRIFFHVFTDGRDAPPKSAIDFIDMISSKATELSLDVKFASISGRYFAMDRDKHFDRTKKAYDAIFGKGKNKDDSLEEVIRDTYKRKKTDEFVEPTTLMENKKIIGSPKDGDAMIFFNIRSDRARQLTSAIVDKNFKGFATKKLKKFLFASLTEYGDGFDIPVIFPEEKLKNTLPEVLSENKKRQLHIAETEKYAHVTYFFSGGREKPFPGETRVIVPSPKVSTFDKKPEMSAREITDKVLKELDKNIFDFIVLNYANPDMVAHTGNIKAAILGLEYVDQCLGEIVEKVLSMHGAVLITSDHGNAEMMINPETKEVDTEHNIFPSPLILIDNDLKNKKETKTYKELLIEATGALCDIAPTILDLMEIKKPAEMTGISLLNTLK